LAAHLSSWRATALYSCFVSGDSHAFTLRLHRNLWEGKL